jgi:FecR protein
MLVSCWALAILASPLAAAAADPMTIVTLLEGQATVVRGVARHALAEGVRLQSGDIIEVGDKGLAQMEFPDGAALALGPKTRVLASSLPRGKQQSADFYVTQGELKLAAAKAGTRLRIATPLFTLQGAEGIAVMVLDGTEGSLFVESGDARLLGPRAKGEAPVPLRLKSGEFYTVKAEQKATVAPRPSPAFIGALPKVFLDPLPSRMARYKDRQVQPKRLDVVSYAEVETWLKAPLEFRRPMLARFQPRAADPAFRAALVANLRFHPEWDPVLFPEKYLPKEPEAEAARGAPAAAPVSPAGKR